MYKSGSNQKGAVSLFIVIFSALLITAITVAFIRIMVQNQQQASTADLSKSALDSALAGVEDAKRAIVSYRAHCLRKDGSLISTKADCVNLDKSLNDTTKCDTIQKSGVAGAIDDTEVVIKQSEGDKELNQAYTCVKVQMDTIDYVGTLNSGAFRLIPLRGTGDFDRIVVEWFSQADLQTALAGSSNGVTTVDLGLDAQLPKFADWPVNRPALIRAQLMQFGDSFKLSDFDKNDDEKTNNASLFLVPSSVGRDTVSFSEDIRQSRATGTLQQIRCNKDFSTTSLGGGYACKATLLLPNPLGPDDYDSRTAHLLIGAIYNTDTTFRVRLENGSNPVLFNDVQPVVDSTGRANDLFRRVKSRVELDSSGISSVGTAVDVSGNLCKTFLVTNRAGDFEQGDCDPTDG